MSAPKKKTDFEPALCRCCGLLTKFRDLKGKYSNMGRLEVYSDMIRDCFAFELSKLDSFPSERLICACCMLKLREAWSFKLQMQETEQNFIQKQESPGSKLQAKSSSERKRAEHHEDSDGTVSDGLDDALDPGQLQLYYSLGNGIEPLATDGYSSAGDDLTADSIDNRWRHRTVKNSMKTIKNKPANISLDDKNYFDNALAIVKYSYACPFKNRFNHVMCYYCAHYFLDPHQLREHSLAHSPKEFKNTARNRYIKLDITRIDCKLCPEKIDNLEEFKRHLVTVHNKLYFIHSKDGVIPFKLVQNVNICTLCGEEFQQFKGLVRHMDQHFSNYVCETCGMGFMDEKSLQKHMPAHDGKRYPCDICGSTLKSEYTLQIHIRRIHEKNEAGSELSESEAPLKKPEVEVACQGCDQTFKSRRYLATHVRKDHMNYRHVCQVCGQKFFTRFALKNHMPTHTGERNFKCKECGKSYPRLKTLKEHTRIHTNDRRYRCNICGQAFIQNCSLKGHMKSKHPEYR